MRGESEKDMYICDMEFDFYSDEPPKYFSRPVNEFDGYDIAEIEKSEKEQEAGYDLPPFFLTSLTEDRAAHHRSFTVSSAF